LIQVPLPSTLIHLEIICVTLAPTGTPCLSRLLSLAACECRLPGGWLASQTALRSLAIDGVQLERAPGEQPDLSPVLAPLRQLTCLVLDLSDRMSTAMTTLTNLQRLFVDPSPHSMEAPLVVGGGPSLRNLRWLCASPLALMRSVRLLALATSLQQLDVTHAPEYGPHDDDSLLEEWEAVCLCAGGLQSLQSFTLFFDPCLEEDKLPLYYTAALLALQRRRPDMVLDVVELPGRRCGGESMRHHRVVQTGWLADPDAAD
jgi:hypothetical protein